MATDQMVKEFGHVERCAFCGKEALCVGPPRSGICAECTDAAAHFHGLLDTETEQLRTELNERDKEIESHQIDIVALQTGLQNLRGAYAELKRKQATLAGDRDG